MIETQVTFAVSGTTEDKLRRVSKIIGLEPSRVMAISGLTTQAGGVAWSYPHESH